MMTEVEDRFVDAARKHGVATRESDPRSANRAYNDLVAALRELRRSPDKGVAFLSTQLDSNDTSVVIWAGLYLLPFKEKEASEALERVVTQGIPRMSFDANMTLKEWRAGRLEVE